MKKRLFSIPLITEEEIQKCHRDFVKSTLENPNNFSYWYPKIQSCRDCEYIGIPVSKVVKVPEEIFDNFGMDVPNCRENIKEFVRTDVVPALREFMETNNLNFPIFVKNGCFSNKFDFNNSCILQSDDLDKITDHIINIQYTALMLDAGGYFELVFREYIPFFGDCMPTIYNGMILRPEIRVFYDFDTRKILYMVNYWDKEYCLEKIRGHNEKDGEMFEEFSDFIEKEYLDKSRVLRKIIEDDHILDNVDLKGQWSIDFLMNSNIKAWLIDMAVAQQSAYWQYERAGMS